MYNTYRSWNLQIKIVHDFTYTARAQAASHSAQPRAATIAMPKRGRGSGRGGLGESWESESEFDSEERLARQATRIGKRCSCPEVMWSWKRFLENFNVRK